MPALFAGVGDADATKSQAIRTIQKLRRRLSQSSVGRVLRGGGRGRRPRPSPRVAAGLVIAVLAVPTLLAGWLLIHVWRGLPERDAISRLPEAQRQVLMLRYYSGLKFIEIAEMIGCPLNTALGRMHKAMIKLKEMMEG